MINSTSGIKVSRAVSAEKVKEQLLGQLIFGEYNKELSEVLKRLIEAVDNLPTEATVDGKKLKKAYYPRIMIKDNCSKNQKPFQIGNNTHHQLIIKRGENSSYISFLNTQCMAGTNYADEGYSFVGEKSWSEYGDDTEIVSFDEVWVEDEVKAK